MAVASLSTALGVSAGQLAIYNPALQATVWQGSKYIPAGFALRLPGHLVGEPIADLVAGLPPAWRHGEQLPDLYHTVARGDTLSEIAETYETRVSTLVALNGLASSNRIRAGQTLRLPAAGPAPVMVAEAAREGPRRTVQPETVGDITPPTLAEEAPASPVGATQTALLSDPSDYGVADDSTIEVQPLETLGHYADWLEVRTQRLRDLNGLTFGKPVIVGARLKLDLGKVNAAAFESRRVAYHRRQQDSFFQKHIITGFIEHDIKAGESIWLLSQREYEVPMWLFRQYNPEVEPAAVRPGTTVRIPIMAQAPSR